jgi:hypothetical protein
MEQWAILKTLSGSSPIFALSIHTTFSQTQTGATVPLTANVDRDSSVMAAVFKGTGTRN